MRVAIDALRRTRARPHLVKQVGVNAEDNLAVGVAPRQRFVTRRINAYRRVENSKYRND